MFIHLFNKYLLRADYMPGSVLGGGDPGVNKIDQNVCLCELTFQKGSQKNKLISIVSLQQEYLYPSSDLAWYLAHSN